MYTGHRVIYTYWDILEDDIVGVFEILTIKKIYNDLKTVNNYIFLYHSFITS